MLKELVLKTRSYRRFYQDNKIEYEQLRSLIDTARLTSSAANRQPLRYILSNEAGKNEIIFKCLGWAGYLKDWNGPDEGEKPSAYVVLVSPKDINTAYDEGIVSQTILLTAVEQGLGGCIFANVDRKKLQEDLELDENYVIKLVIALGCPKEKIVIEEITKNDDIKYYRDENQVHHVPKIRLDDLILEI